MDRLAMTGDTTVFNSLSGKIAGRAAPRLFGMDVAYSPIWREAP